MRNKNKFSRTTDNNVVEPSPIANHVIAGIRRPTHIGRTSGDEETFIPLALATGRFHGVSESTSIFGLSSTSFLNMQLSKLRSIGYDPALTASTLERYYQDIGVMVTIWVYLTNVLRLQDNMHIHTAIPIGNFVSNNMNGSMKVFYNNLTRILQTLPYPKHWVEMQVNGLGITLLSDNVNSPIRMFAPYHIYDGYGEVNQLTVNEKVSIFQGIVNAFYAVTTNVVASQILEHTVYAFDRDSSEIKYNSSTVNNWLNQPYNDGVTSEPNFDNDEEMSLFFRRDLGADDLFTFTPNLQATAGSNVWRITGASLAYGFENSGITFDPRLDAEDFTQYGSIWESSIGLAGSPFPSVTRVFATGNAVHTHVAKLLFG